MKESKRVQGYDENSDSFYNGDNERLKFTPKSMSIYDRSPREKNHAAVHINYNKETNELHVHSRNEDKSKETDETGHCYLTSACIQNYQSEFNDKCHELTVLRWFRDNLCL